MRHPLLLVALGLLCVVPMSLVGASTLDEPTTAPATQPAGAQKVDVDTFDRLRGEPDHVVIDVRTPNEFAAGHLPGAINLPWGGPFEESFSRQIAELDPSQTYLIHCASGRRSEQAGRQMRAAGLDKLYDMEGGMRAWSAAKKPVEKPAS